VSSIIIDDVPPSGMFIIRNSGEDLYGEIMRKYEVFLNEEKELSFHETISAIKQFSVSSKSEEFIRFVETVLSGHYNYKELSRHLIRALLE
jgi:hypothetical protein